MAEEIKDMSNDEKKEYIEKKMEEIKADREAEENVIDKLLA